MTNLLVQKDLGEKRANLIKALQKYDLYVKPTKIFKGQLLCKLSVESSNERTNEDGIYQDQIPFENEIYYIPFNIDQWYYEMKYYLTHG